MKINLPEIVKAKPTIILTTHWSFVFISLSFVCGYNIGVV